MFLYCTTIGLPCWIALLGSLLCFMHVMAFLEKNHLKIVS